MNSFESWPLPKGPELTKVEAHQSAKRGAVEEIVAGVGYFKENPDIRKTIAINPFNSAARELAGRVDETGNLYGTARNAILAEPGGEYETAFKNLPGEDQKKKLYGQIDSSSEMTIRIQKFIEKNIPEVDKMSDENLYKILIEKAFQTDSEDEVQTKYALSQRRGFRLSIINFLEDRNKLSKYLEEAKADPKAFAEKYLGKKLNGAVEVELLPIGLAIHLEEQDYAEVETRDGNIRSIKSKGATLDWGSLPSELKRKIIVLNKGGKETGLVKPDELDETRTHEIRHILFSDFHEQQKTMKMLDTEKALSQCETVEEYLAVSKVLSENFVEQAKDEIIAYFSTGEFDETFNALRLNRYEPHIHEVELSLRKKIDMPGSEKSQILESFNSDRIKCFETVRKIRFVAERLEDQAKNGSIDRDKAEALLRNTPGVKIYRLAKYVNLTADQIKGDEIINKKDQEIIQELNELVGDPENYTKGWSERADKVNNQLSQYQPVGALNPLLAAINKWSDPKRWSDHFAVEDAILSVRNHAIIHGVSQADQQRIKETLENLVAGKKDEPGFERSIELAEKLIR